MSIEENKDISVNEENERKIYELGFLVSPIVPDEKIGSETTAVRDILETCSNVISSEIPSMKDLEYDIDKVIGGKKHHFSSAYFGFFIFETEAQNIEKIKNELEKGKNIVRFIIITRTKESLKERKRKSVTPAAKKPLGIGKQESKASEEKIDEKELDKTIEELVAD